MFKSSRFNFSFEFNFDFVHEFIFLCNFLKLNLLLSISISIQIPISFSIPVSISVLILFYSIECIQITLMNIFVLLFRASVRLCLFSFPSIIVSSLLLVVWVFSVSLTQTPASFFLASLWVFL